MKPCIVVIDDDADTVECLKMALKRQAYEVLGAITGAQGVELARSHRASLVITDVMMPDMNGFDVCRSLRADPAMADVPVVMLSGRGTLADQAAGMQVGADRYVVKPVSLSELASIVKEMLAQSVAQRAAGGAGVRT